MGEDVVKITHTILDLFVPRRTTSKKSNSVCGTEWTISCQTMPQWECVISAIARLILAIGLVIAGCNLSKHMREISLGELKDKSQKLEEYFISISNLSSKIERSASNANARLSGFHGEIKNTGDELKIIRDDLNVLHQEIGKCSNAVNRIWWWWR